MLKKGIKLLLVLLCMMSIFMFSSDTGEQSQKKSDSIIVHIGEFFIGHHLVGKEKDDMIEKSVFFVRKGAHFSIYLILGFLLISLVKEYRPLDYRAYVIAFVIAFLYACSDEIHQLFVSDRSGSVLDVILDSFGSFVGIIIYRFFYIVRRKNNE